MISFDEAQERVRAMEVDDPLTKRIHIKMSGCPNGCGQHHIGSIGFYGASIKIGEHTGRLDEALRNVSYFYSRDVSEGIGKRQSMIEPILTVVMGGLLGWIMLAVLGPVYDTISNLPM